MRSVEITMLVNVTCVKFRTNKDIIYVEYCVT